MIMALMSGCELSKDGWRIDSLKELAPKKGKSYTYFGLSDSDLKEYKESSTYDYIADATLYYKDHELSVQIFFDKNKKYVHWWAPSFKDTDGFWKENLSKKFESIWRGNELQGWVFDEEKGLYLDIDEFDDGTMQLEFK